MVKHYLKVEIAETPFQHQRGLMFRKKLGEDDGMLFKFKRPHNLKFWGVNTFMPLAIAFVSSEKEIVKISYISPCSDISVSSDTDCEIAIEANYDFFKNNDIEIGAKIEIIQEGYTTLVKFVD
ncbi:MAG: DUF192 domain-containing protein [Candidatus Asgardarchaeia archaeon]